MNSVSTLSIAVATASSPFTADFAAPASDGVHPFAAALAPFDVIATAALRQPRAASGNALPPADARFNISVDMATPARATAVPVDPYGVPRPFASMIATPVSEISRPQAGMVSSDEGDSHDPDRAPGRGRDPEDGSADPNLIGVLAPVALQPTLAAISLMAAETAIASIPSGPEQVASGHAAPPIPVTNTFFDQPHLARITPPGAMPIVSNMAEVPDLTTATAVRYDAIAARSVAIETARVGAREVPATPPSRAIGAAPSQVPPGVAGSRATCPTDTKIIASLAQVPNLHPFPAGRPVAPQRTDVTGTTRPTDEGIAVTSARFAPPEVTAASAIAPDSIPVANRPDLTFRGRRQLAAPASSIPAVPQLLSSVGETAPVMRHAAAPVVSSVAEQPAVVRRTDTSSRADPATAPALETQAVHTANFIEINRPARPHVASAADDPIAVVTAQRPTAAPLVIPVPGPVMRRGIDAKTVPAATSLAAEATRPAPPRITPRIDEPTASRDMPMFRPATAAPVFMPAPRSAPIVAASLAPKMTKPQPAAGSDPVTGDILPPAISGGTEAPSPDSATRAAAVATFVTITPGPSATAPKAAVIRAIVTDASGLPSPALLVAGHQGLPDPIASTDTAKARSLDAQVPAPLLAKAAAAHADAGKTGIPAPDRPDPAPVQPSLARSHIDAPMHDAAPAIIAPHAASPVVDVPNPPLDMSRHGWPQAMIERIEALRDAADAVDTSIRVVPDKLGTIDVSVRRDGDVTHIHFAAEQAQTRTILADAQPRLAELADSRGLKLGQSSIDGGAGQHQPRDQRAQTAFVPAAPARAARRDDATTTDHRIA